MNPTESFLPRRRFLRVVGGGAIAAALPLSLTGCQGTMPPEAIAAWQGPAADEPDLRRWALSWAILAPHSHNLQSWLVDLSRPGEILLHCDATRLLPETDPFSRQIMMSHGTFLELLDLAARERGQRCEVALFPEGAFGPQRIDGRPVAHIRLVADASVARDPLFAQIPRRHTNRSAYDLARPVPAAAWQALAAAARMPGLHLGGVGPDSTGGAEALARHRTIAQEAWRIEMVTPRTIMESYKVLRIGAEEVARHRDGLTVIDPMVEALVKLGLFDRSRPPAPDSYATKRQLEDFQGKLSSTPGFFWMVSEGNDRVTQVNAGRAYARVQLAATAAGLAVQPLQQALQEYPEQAGPHAAIRSLVDAPAPTHTVQMWARIGYAPEVSPAPRRGLAAQIVAG